MARLSREQLNAQVNTFLDNNPDLEIRLFVAWKLNQLPAYLEGDAFVSIIETIDNRADFLFCLLRRPLFDETYRLAVMLST